MHENVLVSRFVYILVVLFSCLNSLLIIWEAIQSIDQFSVSVYFLFISL